MKTKFFGKYRAVVVKNADPEMRGRITAQVPDVLGTEPSLWAEACIPFHELQKTHNITHIVPSIGTPIWIEFEGGDINYPVWAGCRITEPL